MNRVKSVLKWVGLYLLVQLFGGIVEWLSGSRGFGLTVTVVTFVILIVHAVMNRRKNASA
jgi:hypothetical protein